MRVQKLTPFITSLSQERYVTLDIDLNYVNHL